MKPRLVKSLIAQNAALLREKQQLIEYFRVVEMVLRTITKNGKDTGIVELVEGMLEIDPKRRLSARRALAMPFFHQQQPDERTRGGSAD